MKKRIVGLFLVSLLMSSCGNSDNRHYDEFSLTLPLDYVSITKTRDIEYKYSDRYFYRSPYFYDKDLAFLSLGFTDYAFTIERATDAFNKIGYKNIYSSDYDVSSDNPHHISFSIASKVMNDSDIIIAVTIRSFEYGSEWASNFTMGKSGNHLGFDVASNTVVSGVDQYIEKYKSEMGDKNFKIWINGYSRGGGTAGLVAVKLIDRIRENKSPFALKKDDIYCYTFEAPMNLDANNTNEYFNIHNTINPNDFVPLVPPSKYGFIRAGQTHYLNTFDIETIIHNFDKDIEYQEFKEKQLSISLKNLGYADVKGSTHDQSEFNRKFIDMMMAPDESGKFKDISTRENYCDNFEVGFSYLLGIFLGRNVREAGQMFMAFFNENVWSLAMSLLSGRLSGLYYAFSNVFNEFQVEYNKEYLLYASTQLEELLTYIIHDIGHLYDEKAIAFVTLAYNIDLVVLMHSPESITALMK